MGKKGSYIGGSTVIKTKPWLQVGPAPRSGRLGIAGMAAADADAFVPRTYVVRAEDIAKQQAEEGRRSEKSERATPSDKRKAKVLAKLEAKRADPNFEKKAEAIREKQAKKMASVTIERKSSGRPSIKKPV